MNNLKKLIKNKSKFKIKAQYNSNREDRAMFAAKKFKNYLKESILDVGCDEGYLRELLSKDVKYIGIDLGGKPDFVINLEIDKLNKFDDKSFHTVLCLDVLEHLNNLHDVFDDICRVSKKYVIISLPNSWHLFKYSLISGKKEYKGWGLPLNNPIDRHKWFFNYEEALNFIRERGKMNNFLIKYHFPVPYHFNSIRHQLFHIFFKIYYRNQYKYNNLFYHTVWALLERQKTI